MTEVTLSELQSKRNAKGLCQYFSSLHIYVVLASEIEQYFVDIENEVGLKLLFFILHGRQTRVWPLAASKQRPCFPITTVG